MQNTRLKVTRTLVIIFGSILVLIVAIICLLYPVFSYVADTLCENQVVSEKYSPDKTLKAIVFHRECGMTVGDSAQVIVMFANKKFTNSDAGNVFIQNTASYKPGGIPDPQVTWISNQTLLIKRLPEKVLQEENEVLLDDWWIRYKAVNINYSNPNTKKDK
jgi:hypothetical protein